MPIPTIRFIPRTFNDLELGHLSGGHNPCSPMYPNEAFSYLMNEVLINVPEKIILPASIPLDSIQRSRHIIGDYYSGTPASAIQPVIPICIASVISSRFGYKFAHLSDEILYIRKAGSEHWFSGKIYDESLDGSEIPPPWLEAPQHYPDDSLNEGQASASYKNLNALQYVAMPYEPGIYEIYYSVLGLESNRVKVEIVFEK